MSLIKKSDVKNHLSARHQNRIHIARISQPDATGFSGTNQAPVEIGRSGFNQDFTGDHTTSAGLAPSANTVPAPTLQAHAGSVPSKP
jgi:hypothetical protein